MKYPIGILSFERIRQDGCTYVNKTREIYRLTSKDLQKKRRYCRMKLYHGTNIDFTDINLSVCRFNKDFGQGFYLTEISFLTGEAIATH